MMLHCRLKLLRGQYCLVSVYTFSRGPMANNEIFPKIITTFKELPLPVPIAYRLVSDSACVNSDTPTLLLCLTEY